MYASLSPYLGKGIKEVDLLPFPWEEQMIKEFTLEEEKVMQEQVEKIKSFYESWDNKNAKA